MAASVPELASRSSGDFQATADAFLAGDGLPFACILSAERIERIFAKHDAWFGRHGIYNTAVVVWAFLSQVLRDGKEASCQAAVARVVCYCSEQGTAVPTSDTGDYCRARAKLSEAALHELSCDVAAAAETEAEHAWLFHNKHAKLIDGFTFTMPDTPQNQAAYPQNPAQKEGVGLPIARAVAVLSLATACVMDLAVGPYSGKQTGEPALLRQLLSNFGVGDIAVADRYYCSFMMIALLLGRGSHVCARKHQRRHSDFRRGKRLGKYDHLITWKRPPRPEWMDEATYAQIPLALTLREIRYSIVEPGRRTKTIDIITTLIDPQEFSTEEIAELYGFRWHSELDIRSIKANLNLGHVRCKSPAMVRSEVWTTLLGYNLIRITAATAAALHNEQPRRISFTATCQYVLACWMPISLGSFTGDGLRRYIRLTLRHIANCRVGNRPGRLEPRVLKRRRHGYPLMQQPRPVLQAKLQNPRNNNP